MLVLADENIPGPVVGALRKLGHDVVWVREIRPNADDRAILDLARRDGRTLLTQDQDFGELALRSPGDVRFGVVLFRLSGATAEADNERMLAVLCDERDWTGCLGVVDDQFIRVRSLLSASAAKDAVRIAVRTRLAQRFHSLRELSASLQSRLEEAPEYQTARTLMIYLSTPSEPDTDAIARRAWQDGKRVLVPRIDWPRRDMAAVEIHSLETDVRAGRHGVREPVDVSDSGSERPTVARTEIDLVLVPGLAFDSSGNRLGRGAGFYDRFLASPELRAVRCGLAFDCQVIETVPTEPHDVRLDLLITESRALMFARPARRDAGQ